MEKDMNMQDKELDALFKNNLENLEAAPSTDLWAGIAAGLEQAERKKFPWAYLGIAATVIVLLTAGIFFIQKDTTKQGSAIVIAKAKPAAKVIETLPAAETPVISSVTKNEVPAVAVVDNISAKKETVIKTTQNELNAPVPEEVEQQPVIALVAPSNNPNPVVPDTDVSLSEKVDLVEMNELKVNSAVMAQTIQPTANIPPADGSKRKRSRGFGGLINSLVSKIDKRKDKLIEFDENQKLTGVNLGIIKITTEAE